MGDNASEKFDDICSAIEALKEHEKKEGKGSTEISFRENTKKDVIKNDQDLMRILNVALKGPAKAIAFSN